MQGNAQGREQQAKGPKFNKLLVAHVATEPAEATLVLAAVAAFNGYFGWNGELMTESSVESCSPSLRKIATELGIGVDAVRRGVAYLERSGVVGRDEDGVFLMDSEVLRDRWADHRRRLKLTRDIRTKGLRVWPLLLAALIAGQVNKSGQLCLGTGFLSERTGMAKRKLERALMTLRQAGVIHTWSIPPKWQLFLAMGPARDVTPRQAEGSTRDRNGSAGTNADISRRESSEEEATQQQPSRLPAGLPVESDPLPIVGRGGGQQHPNDIVKDLVACNASRIVGPPVANRRSPRCESSVHPLRIVGRHPDCPTEYPTEVHTDATAGGASGLDDVVPVKGAEGIGDDPIRDKVVDVAVQLEAGFSRRHIEVFDDSHRSAVHACLHQACGYATREKVKLGADIAEAVTRRHKTPERLARWLTRVARRPGLALSDLESHLRRTGRIEANEVVA